jgi:hypothetical protein
LRFKPIVGVVNVYTMVPCHKTAAALGELYICTYLIELIFLDYKSSLSRDYIKKISQFIKNEINLILIITNK